VWLTDPSGGATSAGQVYRVDTATGALSGTFAPAAGTTVPVFIARGPDGRMWTSDADGTLMRAGRDGAFAKLPAAGSARNGGLAAGPDGNVWYLSISGGSTSGQVGLIDPATLAASQFDFPTADSHPQEISAR
jgi:streptogramin lyase